MKKLLSTLNPTTIAISSLLIVAFFLRYYLFINSAQLIREFKNQNNKELYSMNSLQVSSRLNSLSNVINWVCLEGSISNHIFYKSQRGKCETGLFKQQQQILIPQANNTKIIFTVRLPKEVEFFFIFFFIFQGGLILALIESTKRAAIEMHKNEAKVNKIARQVSHDIRSPLATLNSIVDTITQISPEDQKLLKDAIVRINNISNNLLRNSQKNYLNSSPLPLNQVTNLNEVLEDIIAEKRKEFSNLPNVKITPNISGSICFVLLDAFELKRCISNLVNNSVEARKPNASIHILLQLNILNNQEVEIKIEDNGQGIQPEILKDLGRKEVTSKVIGNGLGLVHTFENIQTWQGKVFIESTVGLGTTISIRLPIVPSEIDTTILLDDDELVRITWESVAKKLKKHLKTYATYEELLNDLNNIDKSSTFYIDSKLSNMVKGEDVADKLFHKGFLNLYLATGYDADQFKNLNFLKGVRDKSPPWN